MKKYLLVIEGGCEPITYGPYDTNAQRLKAAKQFRTEDDGCFKADVNVRGVLKVTAFMASEIDPCFQE